MLFRVHCVTMRSVVYYKRAFFYLHGDILFTRGLLFNNIVVLLLGPCFLLDSHALPQTLCMLRMHMHSVMSQSIALDRAFPGYREAECGSYCHLR
mgnify:CR=1 FL=1